EDWTWADASVELDARTGSRLGVWTMRHLAETMRVEPLLASHLVAQAIVRRQADMDEPVHLTDVAHAVREVVRPDPSVWASFLAQVEADRQAQESRLSLSRLLSCEGGKEAVGDRPVTVDPTRDDARQALREAEDVVRDSRPADVDYALCRAWRAQEEQL